MTEAMQASMEADVAAKIAQEIPQQQFAEPRDIAYGALFLSTDESRYITGQTLVIDGGLGVPEMPWELIDKSNKHCT